MIKYSIITAIYNGKKFIERLASSIFVQTYPNIEWIVQDGVSTDGTVELLQNIQAPINLVSEPDKGIYDAWNKAIDRVTGDWVLFLGADDALLNEDVIVQCNRYLRALPDSVHFAFGPIAYGWDGKVDHIQNRSIRDAYNEFFNHIGFPFPSTFIRASLLKEEKFNDEYKIAGDFELAARLVTRSNMVRIPVVISYMERGGISYDPKNLTLINERKRILLKYIAPRATEFMNGFVKNIENEDYRIENATSSES